LLAKIDVEGFEIRALNGIKRYIIILLIIIIIILFFIIIIIVIIIIKSLVEKDLVETLLIEIAPNRWDRPGLTVEEGNTNTNTNTNFKPRHFLILILILILIQAPASSRIFSKTSTPILSSERAAPMPSRVRKH